METKQVLSIDQMKHLQELGLDTSDASMCWCSFIGNIDEEWELEIYEDVINQKRDSTFWEIVPTYTLQDILDKLPPSINWNPLIIVGNSVMYSAGYGEGYDHPIKVFKEESLLESAYKMLLWIIEQNFFR